MVANSNDAAIQKAEHLSKTCGIKAKAYQVNGMSCTMRNMLDICTDILC
jgi:hypothetical protein